MSTHGAGKNKRHLSVGVPAWLHDKVKASAEASGVSVNSYLNTLLADAVSKGLLVRETREVYEAEVKKPLKEK